MTQPLSNLAPHESDLTRTLMGQAVELHGETGASDILLYADVFGDFSEPASAPQS